jgi:hypothetical protein
MFDVAGLWHGFQIAATPINLMWGLIGCALGTAVGVLPGLGPAATIALLLPISMKMGSPVTAIILMSGIFYGAMSGGSTTSILLKIPGEAASVVTCIDGYEMAKKGRGEQPSRPRSAHRRHHRPDRPDHDGAAPARPRSSSAHPSTSRSPCSGCCWRRTSPGNRRSRA